ncbi:putative metal-binding motif-containing protein [Chondromyces crocatus]|uniref:Right handed beta helix domain-containing protein n=1 Tax=Chondromyces crocatus TaxID=52 RepID=A0A0K1EDJ6_CHOCO|nr:putative metal-binding motif-containing protein [Chondromyces crocatus]AKT38633.1 uncharacterized protein CMC5_027800 [Chondromyces crocatus]
MRAGLAAWLWCAAGGALWVAGGCGPMFTADTSGSGGEGGSWNTGGSGATGGGGEGACSDADLDGDGLSECDGDCDDGNPLIPGPTEICGDGIDNDCKGGADPESICKGLGTFVSPDGDDKNPGTTERPVRTLKKGIEHAQQIGPNTFVYVAEGRYEEDVLLTQHISLKGGHDATSWTWNPAAHPSVIACTSFTCVRANSTISRSTVVEGFTIQAQDGAPANAPGGVTITLDGGSPILRGNRIIGGHINGNVNNAKRSIAVHVLGSPSEQLGALINDNVIEAGNSENDASIGVLIESQAAAQVGENQIRSGSGQSSFGIIDSGARPDTKVFKNRIQAGTAMNGVSYGMTTRGDVLIDSNLINTDMGTPPVCLSVSYWCGGIASYSSASRIVNNVIFGASADQSAAIYLPELDVPAPDIHINSNYLDATGNGSTSVSAKSAAIVLGSPYAGGNPNAQYAIIRNNTLIGGRNQYRYGVYEETVLNQTANPKGFTNNLFFFMPQSGGNEYLYRRWNGTSAVNFAMLGALPAAYTGNVQGDPKVDTEFRLTAGSPCIGAGTIEDAPTHDFIDGARPQGIYDIGPHEVP